ncbi:MAG: hypothetical protein ACT6QS_16745 [Flavobacteriales bacterium]
MKRFFFSALFLALVSAVSAQVTENDAPAVVKSAFSSKYNVNAAAYTSYENGESIAQHNGNTTLYSVFDASGTFIQEEKVVPSSEFPAAVLADVHQRFGTNLEYRKVSLADGSTQYSILYTPGTAPIKVEVYYNNTQMIRRTLR